MSRLTESQEKMIRGLAQPIQPRLRSAYLRAVTLALAAIPSEEIGNGAVREIAASLQRQMLGEPPALGS